MSKTMSSVLSGAVFLLTSLMPKWSRISTLARLSARLIPMVDVPTKHGTVTFYTPTKTAVYWPKGAYQAEPHTLEWIDRLPTGAVLWDIGASVGAYALYAGRRGDISVLAFEANPYTYHCLLQNVQHNGLGDRVKCFCLALDAECSMGELYMSNPDAGSVGNVFGDPSRCVIGANQGTQQVSMLAASISALVRHFAFPFPTHIKIDVDSIEERIIRGGLQVISDPRVQAVLVEVVEDSPDLKERAESIRQMLTSAGLVCDPACTSASGNQLFVRLPPVQPG